MNMGAFSNAEAKVPGVKTLNWRLAKWHICA